MPLVKTAAAEEVAALSLCRNHTGYYVLQNDYSVEALLASTKYLYAPYCMVETTMNNMFHPISNTLENSRLGKLEGGYKHYDPLKKKWIRSGKASGRGGCGGRTKQHTKKRTDGGSNEAASRLPRIYSYGGWKHMVE